MYGSYHRVCKKLRESEREIVSPPGINSLCCTSYSHPLASQYTPVKTNETRQSPIPPVKIWVLRNQSIGEPGWLLRPFRKPGKVVQRRVGGNDRERIGHRPTILTSDWKTIAERHRTPRLRSSSLGPSMKWCKRGGVNTV